MKTPEKILCVICNCPDTATAATLARGLVTNRLAACVNILPAVHSIYRWEDKIEKGNETPLLIKTTQSIWPDLLEWLSAAHPYDVPEIIALPVVAGLPAYLTWIETTIGGQE